ncbi:nicotinate phosphoribosyltransferase [Moraxella macacae 0408225]|uniref:Nicotinamide phosphoribosyltransferase n=1 Tax=Moraxella macacae 0408225 TaxID=1230338 RepID=L2F982_9GAMM|nr:nicotinate phosphoribosyltransferase [Moraxella macacae]ELA09038.1 nicotinate phosphoribosyltransferase [Moraxella macacae 0408225]
MFSSNFHNFILNTDSYKTSHWQQYPPNTEYVSSYIEARGGQNSFESVMFFGLQAFIKEYLTKPISQSNIDEAKIIFQAHGVPFNQTGWQRLIEKHGGFLPLRIQAIPEGMVIPTGQVLCQVVNTDPEFYWLTSYIETSLLRAVWYPSTVASLSYYCKQIIKAGLEKSADNLDGLAFKLHDFGARGVSSLESAGLGGLAHLINFLGTDTVVALVAASRWYGMKDTLAGFSIPAAEHSTMTAWGREFEADAYANMLKQFGGQGQTVAVVSDSYDLWKAIDNIWGNELKSQIETMGGTLVIRPDSGDPIKVVREALQRLGAKFGTTINSKGYKILPNYVRLIQGDGINPSSIGKIIDAVLEAGFSLDNLAFGMGGGLLQQVNRDTLGWAMKTSSARVDGYWRDVYKDPITSVSKRSKRGRLALVHHQGSYMTVREDELAEHNNLLQDVFLNGELLIDDDLTVIRERALQK